MYASVLIEIGVKNVDRTFTYRIPVKYQNQIKIGIRVKVSFGKQNLEGFVIDIFDKYEETYELKEIEAIVDSEPILNQEMLMLGKELSKNTLCSLISAYQVMLPKALKAKNNTNINIKKSKYLTLNKDRDIIENYIDNCKYEKQIIILNKILDNNKIKIDKLDSSINTLLKHNLIKIDSEEDFRYHYEISGKYKDVVLTEEQSKVVNTVVNNFNNSLTYLLYGVTGSGKTEVYMNIINKALDLGKSAIMLVPEISLTPQIVDRFMTKFGNNVAILHSGLSDTERYDEYRKIKNGQVKIVVGARSAIFAPLENIGVIIIDEEHTATYKQDNHPRYHARDIAVFRSKYHNCPVVLGSATPSLESFARANNGVYQLLVLKNRIGSSTLPKVNIIDMKEEIKKGNYVFSSLLDNKIKEKLSRNEQIILLLNRRGYSSIITCSNCGYIEKCPNCDISLTYHKTSDMLRCHYCGFSKKKMIECPKCGSEDIKDYGLGTEKLEEEIIKKYNARVIRMDIDTTSKKGSHQKIIEEFGNHKYDILLGTQMIAKGLDFPLVTLVGVINADMSLNIPDFRSAERTFQLLCQVSGRAGRSSNPGEVVIQTYNNEHYSINYAKNHDYLSFYKEEMNIRKLMNYTPYYFITLVKITSKKYDKGFEEAKKVGMFLRKNLSSDSIVLGPTMANVFKINNVFHFQCIIKYKKDDLLMDILTKIDEHYKSDNTVNVEIDVEPLKM